MAKRFTGSVTGYINELEAKIAVMMKLVRLCEQIPETWSTAYVLDAGMVFRIKETLKELKEITAWMN